MKVLKLVATGISLAITCLGVIGITAPDVLLEFGRSSLAPPALYWVIAVRIVFGGLLIRIAAESRFPKVLRVVGVVIIVASILTLVFGAERFLEVFDWLSAQEPMLIRVIAVLPVIVGLFFAYAINRRPHGAA